MTTDNITVLFTDLVGSTQLQSSVAPEVADELRRDHFTVLRQAIAEAGGREVKNLGDGLMAVFGSASAAIACAVAMQQGVELDGRGRDRAVGLRVGLSGGEVTREEDDYFGDPVIEASRLCGICEGGQILAAELVRLMAGRRNPHVSRPLGPLELKGLPDPVDVVEVQWEPVGVAATEHPSLPGLLTERGRFPFAGRQKEAEILLGAFTTVTAGATRLVLVAGEPGIGKTRLTSELAEKVLDAGGLVVAGRSDELVGVPYQPFVEALRWRMAQPGGVDHLGSRAGELVRLVPELAQVVRDLRPPLSSSPEAERLALFEAVREWLTALAADHPVLLVLDDLHWADMGTLLLLRHVVVNDPVPNLLVVATYRDTDLDRTHPLAAVLAEFHRRGEVERIALSGLDGREVTDLVSLTAGHDLDEAGMQLASTLTEDTGGNPFFVGEVLRHLAESGAITQEEGRWVAAQEGDAYLPEGIRQVIGRRLSVLPEQSQKLLSAASVIGARFDLDLLATVSGSSGDDVLDAIEPAIAAHLVLETGIGSYQFAHALVRSTLHGELSTTRRARLHLAVAQALEAAHADDLDAVTGDLAYHWGEAGAANLNDAAFTYAKRAAELAWERLAPDDAVRWYRIARERLDDADPALDAELLCRLGIAESLAGETMWQATLVDAARKAETVGDVATMTEALGVDRRSVMSVHAATPNPEKISLLERALELSDNDVAQKVRLTLALSHEVLFTGDLSRRTALYLEAMTLADDISNPLDRFRTISGLAGSLPFSLMDRAYFESASATNYRETLRLAHERSDHEMEQESLVAEFWRSLILGLADLEDLTAELETLFAVYPSPLLLPELLRQRYFVAIVRGAFSLSAAIFEEYASQAKLTGSVDTDLYAPIILLQRVRETDGLGVAIDILATHPALPLEQGLPGLISGLYAHVLAESGRLEEAARLVVQAGGNAFADMLDDAALPIVRSSWAEAAALVADTEACQALFERLLPYHDIHQVTGFWYSGSTARYLALLSAAIGNEDDADRWFTQAIEDHERIASPPWLARTRIDWAEHLLRRGESQRAHELARAALKNIGTLELTVSRSRAEALLASTPDNVPHSS